MRGQDTKVKVNVAWHDIMHGDLGTWNQALIPSTPVAKGSPYIYACFLWYINMRVYITVLFGFRTSAPRDAGEI